METLLGVVLIAVLMSSKEFRGLVAIIVVCAVVAGYWNVDQKAEARLQQVAPTIELGAVKHVITVEAPPPEEDDADEPVEPVTVEASNEHGALIEE